MQASLRPAGRGLSGLAGFEEGVSSSRYAEPEAEGVMPVLRTGKG